MRVKVPLQEHTHLIRQSCEAKKRAPILWFGDRVDFGSYQKSLKRGAEKKDEIEFTFDLKDLMLPGGKTARNVPVEIEKKAFEAEVSIAIRGAGQQRSFAPRVRLTCLGYQVEIRLSETNNVESIKCGLALWKPVVTDFTEATYESILPRINILREVDDAEKRTRYVEFAPFSDTVIEQIVQSEFANFEPLFSAILAAPLLAKGTLGPYMLNRFRYIDRNIHQFDFDKLVKFLATIETFVFGSKINELLSVLDDGIKSYFSGVKYIEPLRATAQRYYRKQELALDEIDAKGENLAMYLDNIGPWPLERFNEWTKENFGFTARTTNDGGHVAVVICEDGVKHESNLADIGFGFSQILPIVTQLWLSSQKAGVRAKRTTCIVIEQPELHLHPSFQAKLADVFAATVAGDEDGPQLIIETHSNHIVNRLGQLISEGKLGNDKVQILIFEKNGDSSSSIRKSGFDEDGYLTNWPTGFFEPGL